MLRKSNRNYRQVFLFLVLASLLTACGPSMRTAVRWQWKPYDTNEYSQSKDGITIENRELKEMPSQFFVTAQECNQAGVPFVDSNGAPVMQRVSLVQPDQLLYRIAITNDTEHVVRMNSVVMRLFDPANNQIEPTSKEDAISMLITNRNCPSTARAAAQFRLIKFFSRNMELLPGTTTTGYLMFRPPSKEIPGTWKLALYDVPTQTDPAGNITRRTRFEMRMVANKYVDTFRQENFLASWKLVKTEKEEN